MDFLDSKGYIRTYIYIIYIRYIDSTDLDLDIDNPVPPFTLKTRTRKMFSSGNDRYVGSYNRGV